MKDASISAMRTGWARLLVVMTGVAFFATGFTVIWAGTWQPNLTLQIADDEPIHARSEDPYRIVVQDYQSSSVPGLHVNDLLVELRMDGAATVGFIMSSTSSIVDPPDGWMAAHFWYERPDSDAPERVSFDASVSVNTAGLFPETVETYQTLTHLYGYLLAVQGDGDGEVNPAGELSDALTEIRGYLAGPDHGNPANALLAGEVSSSFRADTANPIHTFEVDPPDVPGEATKAIESVQSVMSFDLADRNGFFPVVSGEFTVNMLPASTNTTNISTNHYHVYGANVGWINARGNVSDGAVIGQFYGTGYLYGANVGWIRMGSGTPANGYAYANDSAMDWGVNHDGVGNLRGMAYGANIGWVVFEDIGDPRVDLANGNLSGYVWGANVGWISLSNQVAFVQADTLDPGPDTDGDGIPDAWEYMMAGDLETLGPHPDDYDGDGVSDYHEYLAGTDPLDPDDRFEIVAIDRTGHTNTLSWTAVSTRLYRIETTDELKTNGTVWVDSGLGVISPDPSAIMSRDIVQTNDMEFIRARVILPLAP